MNVLVLPSENEGEKILENFLCNVGKFFFVLIDDCDAIDHEPSFGPHPPTHTRRRNKNEFHPLGAVFGGEKSLFFYAAVRAFPFSSFRSLVFIKSPD